MMASFFSRYREGVLILKETGIVTYIKDKEEGIYLVSWTKEGIVEICRVFIIFYNWNRLIPPPSSPYLKPKQVSGV